ncbi:MAG: oxygen-independent coproporphyrinogen III oxidase [Beijerinckiaceae bacterium]
MQNPNAALILAERSAPRYTSYPTAPHFTPAVGPEQARTWLGDLPAGATLSLYLHVPYCRAICNYCGCHTKAALRDEPLGAYARWLDMEIALLARASAARRVTHIHWGGGTPSLLGPARIAGLMVRLRESFDLSKLSEHAIELDPRHVSEELAAALAKAGVNRVSLGVQDMHPHVQKAIGRVQPPEIVEASVAVLRAAGISAINLDLMYGLPYQSTEDVRRTVRWAASLDPARLAIFGYAHVPWMKKHQRLIDAATLPGAGMRLEQAAAARETLVAGGFDAIGLDHFARPGDPMAIAAKNGSLKRNFQGYTTDAADAVLPLGVSSIGRLPQGYIQNAPDIGNWSRAIEAGRFATVRGVAFSGDDIARAEVIERLMCDEAVDFGAIAEKHFGAAGAFDDAISQLDQLASNGVLERAGRRIALTQAGAPFVRLAAAAFDSYLAANAARHSVAV